jgi:hypothetical protein
LQAGTPARPIPQTLQQPKGEHIHRPHGCQISIDIDLYSVEAHWFDETKSCDEKPHLPSRAMTKRLSAIPILLEFSWENGSQLLGNKENTE